MSGLPGQITGYDAIDTGLFPTDGDLFDISQIVAVVLFPPSVTYESRKLTYEQLRDALAADIGGGSGLSTTLSAGNTAGEQEMLSDNNKSGLDLFDSGNYAYFKNDVVHESSILMDVDKLLLTFTVDGTNGGTLQSDVLKTDIIHTVNVNFTAPLLSWTDLGTSEIVADGTNFYYQTGTGGGVGASDTVAYITVDSAVTRLVSVAAEQILLLHDVIVNVEAPSFFYQDGLGVEIFANSSTVYLTTDGGLNSVLTIQDSLIVVENSTQIDLQSPIVNVVGGNMYFDTAKGIDSVATGGTDVLKIGVTNANQIDYGNGSIDHNFTGLIKGKILFNAGTATAGTAPAKFQSGTNLTTPESGAIEFDGTYLYFTPSATRETIMTGNTAGTWVAHSSTITGFSGTPTQAIEYIKIGKLVIVNIEITGTSNSSGFTITLPTNAARTISSFIQRQDNGTKGGGILKTAAGSDVATLYTTSAEAVWTTSGTKSCNLTLIYESQ